MASLCECVELVASQKGGHAWIARQPFDRGMDWAPLAVANTHAEDRAESNRNPFANMEPLLGDLVIQYFRFSSPFHWSMIARALSAPLTLAVTIAPVAFAEAWQKPILEFVELLIFLLHLV